MDIRKIDIPAWEYWPLSSGFNDKRTDIKMLPYLSLVQAKKGSYDIKLDESPIFCTGEGGFFVAPAGVRQTIVHHAPSNGGKMYARWLFLDARINGKYTLDELFLLPVVLDSEIGEKIDKCFDDLEKIDSYCEKMSILYRIIGLIIEASEGEKMPEGEGIVNAIKYIHQNYTQKITIGELAKIANMSESNLYTAFKKRYTVSPHSYLTRLRLSVASGMLSDSSASISTIAMDIGIHDSFYFSKLFKKLYGVSPSEYRKKHLRSE